jgi:hypothetical protein
MRLQAFRESPFATPPIQFNSCPEAMNNLDFGDIVDTTVHDVALWTAPNSHFSPPHASPIKVTADGSAYVKNSLGLTVGGIQLPQVTVPTGILSGQGNTGVGTCTLAGEYLPFSATALASLYHSHSSYVEKFSNAVRDAEKQGFIQPLDGAILTAQAEASDIPATTYVP